MTDTVECEITIAMDEEGNWIVCRTYDDDVGEAINEMCVENSTAAARIVKLTVRMKPPEVEEGTVTVPDEAGTEIKTEFAP